MNQDLGKLTEIFDRYPRTPQSLIGVLQDIQKEFHYLPSEALEQTATELGVPLSKVFSVSTFYNAFSLTPRGEKVIRICVGTTCHIRGANQLQERFEHDLGIKAGETTYDLEYTLLTVNCLGCCALGPVVVVDNTYHSVRPWQADSVLALHEESNAPGRTDTASPADRKGA